MNRALDHVADDVWVFCDTTADVITTHGITLPTGTQVMDIYYDNGETDFLAFIDDVWTFVRCKGLLPYTASLT